MRNNFRKVCAVVLCIGILSLAAPGAFAVQKKSSTFDLFRFFQKQITYFASMFTKIPVLDFLSPTNNRVKFVNGDQKEKTTGQIDIGRVSDGD